MTTVVWAKNKLASDSLRTRGGVKSSATVKKIILASEHEDGEKWKIMGRKVIALTRAGQPGCEFFIMEALASAEGITHRTDLKIPSKMSFQALLIDEFHDGWTVVGSYKQGNNTPDSLVLTQCYQPTAIGSGGIHAEAAVRMGYSAKKAIKLAKLMDPSTGGKVQVVKLPKAVKRK